jgi:hypothetical protein
MRDYFLLQYRIINRHLSDFGIHPLSGYSSGVLMFAAFSAYLWYVTPYAPYIYALLGLSLTTLLSETGRINFMRQWFSKKAYLKIRIIENLIAVAPFVTGLLVTGEWLLGLALTFIGLMLSLSSVNNSLNIVIPTPFSSHPFEFTVGFRKNIFILFFSAFLMAMAILYTNANLGLFVIALVLLVCLAFYFSAETTYMVWVHNMRPAAFLWHKIKLAILNTSILVFPFVAVFVISFPSHGLYLLLLYPLGLLYIITALLGKYAFFPLAMNMPQGLLMAFSFWFPPLLLFLLPYFYRRCLQQLNPILS